MKRRLFLTGEIGAGKSTAIAEALGDKLPGLDGFLTRRCTDPEGRPVAFTLEPPKDGKKEMFLDLSSGTPQVHMAVFEGCSLQGGALILDEIGGIDLLCPAFWSTLEKVLRSDVPVIGVVKGKQASHALAAALGLAEEYHRQWETLWELLAQDENTMVYSCEKYDEKALILAKQWAGEYCL